MILKIVPQAPQEKSSPSRVDATITLPAELYDRIIDFVASDAAKGRTALHACALTCRLWLPRSRFHLFRAVQVTSFYVYDRLDAVLRANPDIARCIRVLHFEIGVRGSSLLDHARLLPVSLLARLPHLQSVKYYAALTAQTPALRTEIAGLPRMDTVTTFSVNVCVFQKLADMLLLLAAFPSLRHLQLFEVFFLDGDYASCLADTRYARALPLLSLHMESLHEAPAIFGWLMDTASILTLSTLSIGLDRSEHLRELDDFLRACGESIRHLSFRSRSILDNKYRILNLAHNINLRSLTFRMVFLSDIHSLPCLLSTITSSSVIRITVRLLPRLSTPCVEDVVLDLVSIDFGPFDALLASTQFPALRAVVFDFSCPVRQVEIRPTLTRQMPLLHARGCIVVAHEIA